MEIGAITDHADVAQIVLYAFWVFFFGLLFYLRREDRREGYPLESEVTGEADPGDSFIWIPEPKTFHLYHGGKVEAPTPETDKRKFKMAPAEGFTGAAFEPTGNPMKDGVGPAAWAQRSDKPERTAEGDPKIVPLKRLRGYSIEERDPDPREMDVVGADGETAGSVTDVWVDRSELLIRYLEVALGGRRARTILVPMPMARINASRGVVEVDSILASQFSDVPETKSDREVTLLEEDKICAYYGGGTLYATPTRVGPMI